jgi:6-pyruvoyltetrahydropterin/6-carboxytetrahydropterin synthase
MDPARGEALENGDREERKLRSPHARRHTHDERAAVDLERYRALGNPRSDRRLPVTQRDARLGRNGRRTGFVEDGGKGLREASSALHEGSGYSSATLSVSRANDGGLAMWEISQETVVAAAHQLRFAPGEGERLHGHNWRIRAVVRAKELDARGFVVDFNDLGATLRALVEPYEHAFLNEIPPFDDVNPSAENLARVVADGLAAKVEDGRVTVARVEVWENDQCCAIYYRA